MLAITWSSLMASQKHVFAGVRCESSRHCIQKRLQLQKVMPQAKAVK